MNTLKTVALVYRLNGDFSDELIFTDATLPGAKYKAIAYCKRHGIKILSKRDNFGYPAMYTRDNITWLCSAFNFQG